MIMMKQKNEGIEMGINELDNLIEVLERFKNLRDSKRLEDGDFEGTGNLGIGFYENKIYIEEYEEYEENEEE